MWWTLMDSNHRAVRTWFTARRNRPTLPSVRSAKRTPRYLAPREGVEPPTLQAACSQSSHSSAGTGSTQVDPVSGLSLRLRRPALFSTELTRRCHLGCVRTRSWRDDLVRIAACRLRLQNVLGHTCTPGRPVLVHGHTRDGIRCDSPLISALRRRSGGIDLNSRSQTKSPVPAGDRASGDREIPGG